jgi:preprotein translocase subunit SecA
MSRGQALFGALFGNVALASARPYVERGEAEPDWHDRLARALFDRTLGPAATALEEARGGMRRIAGAAAAFEAGMQALPDAQLRARAAAMRARLRRDGLAFALVAECFALIREAAGRTLGLRHFPNQMMAGYGLLRGRLVEMATGEGKTFSATLAACTMGLAGYPVHVITVNDYLAQRDADKMRPLYEFLGLSVGTVVQGQEKDLRRRAYAQAITYCTNKELAFDYLRDQVTLAGRSSRLHQALGRLAGAAPADGALVLRGLYFAIVDEADSVFIDEARTPLILSASRGGGDDAGQCAEALAFAAGLEEGPDYLVSPLEHRTALSDAGRARLDRHAKGRDGVWTSVRGREELVRQALSAIHLYRRDQHYVVAEGRVQIVDESTGRVMADRSWERGLHQMIEIKEGVAPTPRRETLARLTYQRLFRRFLLLSGMTGTGAEVAREIRAVYGLGVARIPLHRPSRRIYGPSVFCLGLDEKWEGVADVAARLALGEGRPVLIGTRSVQASEQVSAVLQRRGIAHALLNAKQDAVEADVIAAAGAPGRVTVATNMAGRGTDIELGDGVDGRGGLHVILTEYHDSRRVDRQLFGRSARQGDAGSCEAIVSLEDEIFEVYAPGAAALLRRALQSGVRVPRAAFAALRWLAQWTAERHHRAVRMQHIKQDRQLDRTLAFTGKGE